MKAWRRTRDYDGSSRLEEVSPGSLMGPSKSVVIALPGAWMSHHPRDAVISVENKRRAIAGGVATIETLLGGPSPNPLVDIISISYDSTNVESAGFRHRANENNNYVSPEAGEFVDRYLMPLIAAGKRITLVAYSFGSAFAEMSRVDLIERLRQQGFSEKGIRTRLESIVLIGVATVSRSIDPEFEGRNSELDFTSIFFSSRTDTMVVRRVPALEGLVPANGEQGNLAIVRLTGNRLLVVMNTPDKGFVWMSANRRPRFSGTSVMDRSLSAHSLEFFAVRNPGTAPGAVLALERALRNAVNRTEYVDAVSLIRTPANAISAQRPQYSLSSRVSYEAMAIEEALRRVMQPTAESSKRANRRTLG